MSVGTRWRDLLDVWKLKCLSDLFLNEIDGKPYSGKPADFINIAIKNHLTYRYLRYKSTHREVGMVCLTDSSLKWTEGSLVDPLERNTMGIWRRWVSCNYKCARDALSVTCHLPLVTRPWRCDELKLWGGLTKHKTANTRTSSRKKYF